MLATSVVARSDLQLEHAVPQLLVGAYRGVERADGHLSVLARMRAHRSRSRDKTDALLDVVAAGHELLPSPTQRTVGPVPGERSMPDARLGGELAAEERLPAGPVTRRWSVVEQEQVPPVERRVLWRAHHHVSVSPLDDPIEGQHVEISRPNQRP